jgi:drug/metabolite transporter (DMT)-like permease
MMNQTNSLKTGTILPVAALLWTATFWGVVWYPLRLLEQAGLGGLWTTWIIFATSAVVGIWIVWSRRRELLDQPGLLLLLALANGWLNTAFVLAIIDGNVLRVMLLFSLSPLWSTLLAWLWLGERPSSVGLSALALAMVGAMLMLWNPDMGFPWPQNEADWLAISSGLGFSVSNVAVRRLRHLSSPLKASVAWWGVVVVAGIWLFFAQIPWPQNVSSTAWVGAVVLGGVGIFSATLAVVYGVARLPIHRSAIILLFELVVGALTSQWLTEEIVTTMEWFGGGLIVLAAYLSVRVSVRAGKVENPAS